MKQRARPGQKGRRGQRVASVVHQIVSEALVTRLSDPRLAFMTVTGVDVAADMRFADVRVSVLGDAKVQEECLRGIRHARGRLQEKVAGALGMKVCPILRFHLDQSVKRSVSISALIAKARAEDEAARAERIRRGVESPDDAPPVPEESPPEFEDAEAPGDEDPVAAGGAWDDEDGGDDENVEHGSDEGPDDGRQDP